MARTIQNGVARTGRHFPIYRSLSSLSPDLSTLKPKEILTIFHDTKGFGKEPKKVAHGPPTHRHAQSTRPVIPERGSAQQHQKQLQMPHHQHDNAARGCVWAHLQILHALSGVNGTLHTSDHYFCTTSTQHPHNIHTTSIQHPHNTHTTHPYNTHTTPPCRRTWWPILA